MSQMRRVEITADCTFRGCAYAFGQVVELPEVQAQKLIRLGLAKPAMPAKPAKKAARVRRKEE